MSLTGLGIDIVDVRRFRAMLRAGGKPFIVKYFTEVENEYCSGHSDPAMHFAGTFAAKEAVQKTLIKSLSPKDIELRHARSGKPEVWLRGRRMPRILISISHERSAACAVAIHI